MRIKAKRIISLCLAVVIMATSVGYGPPAVGAEYMPYIELEEDANIATTSEAVRPSDKATPSEAVPPEEKATPSEAERKFIRVEPEDVPEYYKRASVSNKKFWKFEDRYGNEHYRNFGYVNGEAVFPLWYEADENGIVNEEFISINLDDEYFDLAPYIWNSLEPNNKNWYDLEQQYQMNITNSEKLQFNNWDDSSYDIWYVRANEIEENIAKDFYFFYGYIKNIKNESNGEWFESDKNGNIKLMIIQQRSMRSDNYRSLKLYFYNNIPGETDSNSPSYDLTVGKFRNNGFQYEYSDGSEDGWMTFDVRDLNLSENTQMITFPNLEKEGYTFLGYLPEFFSSYSPTTNIPFFANEMQADPQNYDYLVGYDPNYEIPLNDKSGATLYVPAASFMHPIKTTKNLMNTTTGFPLIKPDSKTSVAYLIGGINSSYINLTDRPNSISFYGVWEKEGLAKLSLIDNTRPIYSQWDAKNVQFNMFNTSLEHYRSISYKEFGTTIDISGLLTKDPFSGIYAYDTAYLKDYINFTNSRFGGYFSKIAGGGERLNIKNYTYDNPDDKYYAYWYNPNNSFSVYYFDDEDFTNRLMKETVMAGGKSIPPDAPIKPGYIFTHWEDPNSPSMRPDYIIRTSTFVPKYVKEEYFNIKFVDWDGRVISEQNIQIGSNAIPPDDPVREGHTFLGWDKPYINIQNDEIITAQYQTNNYNLTLNANGGLFNSHDGKTEISFGVGEGYDLNSIIYGKIENKPSMPYHTFEGWYTERLDGDKYDESKSNIMPSSDLNLYAHWARTSYEVTFVDWNDEVLKSYEVPIGGNAIPPADPSREGYTFVGWDVPLTNILSDTTITAQYSINTHKIIFYGNGGTIDGNATKEHQVEYGVSIDTIIEESTSKASRKYFEFVGWYTEAGIKIRENGNEMPDSDLELYAHWVRSSSIVTYKDWDGTIIDRQEIAIGENATPPPTDPVRPGYTFKGWDKPPTNIRDHTVITAKYTINAYTLTFDGNGGTFDGYEVKSFVLNYEESIDQFLIDEKDRASRRYYTFDGWYDDPVKGTKYPIAGNKMPASDLTLYAHWVRTANEVTFVDWNDEILKSYEVPIGGNAIPPTDPSRIGHTFIGWDKPLTNIQSDTTITAQYSINTHKIMFYGNGGTIDGNATKEHQVEYGVSIDTIIEESTSKVNRKYFVFDGWYTEAEDGIKIREKGNEMPDSDIELYAHWVRSSSLVTYKDWDGTTLKTEEVSVGGDATPPADPTRPGYTFSKWDKPSTNIQNHTTITAEYTINGHKLTLDGNGGTLEGSALKELGFKYGESYDQALADGRDSITLKYHTFDGWYSSPTGGTKYSYTGNTMPDSNVIVYAHWVRSSSLVTYKDWDGTTIKTEEVAIGADATPPADPTRPGYTFSKWDKPSTNIQNHTTITAEYTINGHKLTLDGNGGTLEGSALKELGFKYGESYDQALADGRDSITLMYHTFDGWYSSPTGGTKYSYTGNTMPDSNVIVYAHWVRSSSLVTYKDWDGTTIKTEEVAIGADATPPADPTRPGYTFSKWDKPSTNIQNHTTITAEYTINSYKLTLDGNGGSMSGSVVKEWTVTYNDSFDQILTDGKNEVSQPGYTFDGWYTSSTGGNKYTYSGNRMPDSDITVYAHWKENPYTVSFDPDHEKWTGGVIQKVYTTGTELGSLPAPEIYGWEFLGWWTGRNGTGERITEKTKTGTQDVTYYGNWKLKQCILHFDKNLSAVEKNPEDKIVTYGETVGSLPVINAEGYTFLGWYTAPTGGDKVTETTLAPLGETTCYAHWDKKSEPTEPEPSNPGSSKPDTTNESGKNEETKPVDPGIDTNTKPTVPDTGGSFTVNPEDTRDVTYTKPDGTAAKDEWVGDGEDWYHVDENGKLNYDWFLEGERTWYKLNKQPGDKFGAALIGWNYEPMDDKRYFFDPSTTKMLTGWQKLDGKWYYFTTRNECQTYFGNNHNGWLYDPEKPGKPYGSMYRSERTPDGYRVNENGVLIK